MTIDLFDRFDRDRFIRQLNGIDRALARIGRPVGRMEIVKLLLQIEQLCDIAYGQTQLLPKLTVRTPHREDICLGGIARFVRQCGDRIHRLVDQSRVRLAERRILDTGDVHGAGIADEPLVGQVAGGGIAVAGMDDEPYGVQVDLIQCRHIVRIQHRRQSGAIHSEGHLIGAVLPCIEAQNELLALQGRIPQQRILHQHRHLIGTGDGNAQLSVITDLEIDPVPGDLRVEGPDLLLICLIGMEPDEQAAIRSITEIAQPQPQSVQNIGLCR